MRTVGLSVPDVVREIITRNRSIHDCMAMDVINYTALAVKIQPEVQRQIGNPIHLNTIVVAIKRYADAYEKNEERCRRASFERCKTFDDRQNHGNAMDNERSS